MAIAALFSVALAQPELRVGAAPRQGRVLLLDTTTSMAAEGRWPAALGAVRRELAGVDARAALISLGPRPSLLWRSGESLRSALSGVALGGTGADLVAAIRLARAVAPGAEVVLVGDGGLADEPSARDVDRHVQVGDSLDNIGLVDVQVQTDDSALGRGDRLLFARVHSFAERSLSAELRLRVDGHEFGAERIDLDAEASRDLSWRVDAAAREAELSLEIADGLDLDDLVRIPLDDRRPRVQWLGDSAALAQALAALPLTELRRGTTRRLSADERFDVTVVAGSVPEALPRGGLVLVNPAPGPWLDGAVAMTTTLPSVGSDPLLEGLDLVGASIASARAEEGPDWSRVLLRTPERALIWEGRRSGRSVVVMAFDPDGGDLTRRAAWPVLLGRAIAQVAALPPRVKGEGQPVQPPGRWPEGARARRVDPPSEGWLRLPARLVEPGLWSVEALAGTRSESLRVLVPAGHPRESDLRPRKAPASSGGVGDGEEMEPSRRALWPTIIAIVALLMAIESSWSGAGGASRGGGGSRLRPRRGTVR